MGLQDMADYTLKRWESFRNYYDMNLIRKQRRI